MIYTRSSQYAIRAMRYLATQKGDGLSRLEEIAGAEEVPQAFLAKLMQRLVKRRLVRSLKGMRGGFALNMPPERITLYMIVDAMDDLSYMGMECAFGNRECSDTDSCALHERWKDLKSREADFLKNVTLSEIVRAASSRKKTATGRAL